MHVLDAMCTLGVQGGGTKLERQSRMTRTHIQAVVQSNGCVALTMLLRLLASASCEGVPSAMVICGVMKGVSAPLTIPKLRPEEESAARFSFTLLPAPLSPHFKVATYQGLSSFSHLISIPRA